MQHSPGFIGLVEEARQRVEQISVQEAASESKQEGVYLVDVREESEWNLGHADRAIHLSKGIIERDIEKRIPDQETIILCYCGGGYRSVLVADNLQKMGYKHIKSVIGGYKAWVEARLPVSKRPEKVPRSPYEKLGEIIHLPRFIDKARLFPLGKLPGYEYLNVGFDRNLLDFLCIEPTYFEELVLQSPDDETILNELKKRLGPSWPSDHAIKEFNDKLARRRPENAEKIDKFEKRRAEFPPTKKKIETYFDLMDLEEGRFEES